MLNLKIAAVFLMAIFSSATALAETSEPYLVGGANVTCTYEGCYLGRNAPAPAPVAQPPSQPQPHLSQEQQEALAFAQQQLQQKTEQQ